MNYYKTILRADYVPTLKLCDKLFSLALKFDGYPDWWTDKLSVTLQNFEFHCSLHLGLRSYVYSQDVRGKRDEDDRRIRKALEIAAGLPELAEYKRLGFRRMYLHEVSMNFESLVSLVADKFFAQNDRIKAGICPKPEDEAPIR